MLGLAGTGLGLTLPKSSYAQKPEPFRAYGNVKITKLETFLVKPRWIFLKIHTDVGVVGLGEPLLEGRALTIQTAIKEVEPYLIGKDPRRVVHHWQAIYRHAFYRGGPILTSALSGIDQAPWDIKGKLLNVPIYELLGDRDRVYGRASNAEDMKQRVKEGYTVIKTGVAKKNPANIVENPRFVKYAIDNFASLRDAGGPDMDIAIDFHGAISPQLAKVLIKELEPYQPMFVEEPCQAQNVDVMADIARGTYLPIATGERIFTKWGFREILEKGAASILQPDLCHADGQPNNVDKAVKRITAKIPPGNFNVVREHGYQGVNYSERNDLTGFIKAARMLWKLTVSRAIPVASAPARANIHQAISILYGKSASHFSMTYQAAGEAITKAMSTNRTKSAENKLTMLTVVAPNTFRMPTSLVRASAMNATTP